MPSLSVEVTLTHEHSKILFSHCPVYCTKSNVGRLHPTSAVHLRVSGDSLRLKTTKGLQHADDGHLRKSSSAVDGAAAVAERASRVTRTSELLSLERVRRIRITEACLFSRSNCRPAYVGFDVVSCQDMQSDCNKQNQADTYFYSERVRSLLAVLFFKFVLSS